MGAGELDLRTSIKLKEVANYVIVPVELPMKLRLLYETRCDKIELRNKQYGQNYECPLNNMSALVCRCDASRLWLASKLLRVVVLLAALLSQSPGPCCLLVSSGAAKTAFCSYAWAL